MLNQDHLNTVIEAVHLIFEEPLDGDDVDQIKDALNEFYANN